MRSFIKQTLMRISLRAWKVRFKLLYERLEGVDFSTTLQPEDVGLDSSTVNRCSPSGNRFLKQVLQQFEITDRDHIVDIGCGKGSAMRVMLGFPFAKVDGIELSDTIASIARNNFRKLRITKERCTIYTGDATRFQEIDQYNYIYLYNPFPCQVMGQFMQGLEDSLLRRSRKLILIYNNAVCHDEVIAGHFMKKQGEYPDEWGNKIAIYESALSFAGVLGDAGG